MTASIVVHVTNRHPREQQPYIEDADRARPKLYAAFPAMAADVEELDEQYKLRGGAVQVEFSLSIA
jgi:hypothetical protein